MVDLPNAALGSFALGVTKPVIKDPEAPYLARLPAVGFSGLLLNGRHFYQTQAGL